MTASTRPSSSICTVGMSSRMFITVTMAPPSERYPRRSATMIGKLRIALYSSTRRTMRFGEAASSARRSGLRRASAANSKVAMYFMVSSSEGNGEDGLGGPPVGGAGEAAADAEIDADLLKLGVDHGLQPVVLLLEPGHE